MHLAMLLLRPPSGPSRRLLTSAAPVTAGSFQNPIVEQLWSLRSSATSTPADPSSPLYLASTPRPSSHSRTAIAYPFSSSPYVSELYKSPWGTVRIGSVLEDLDALAGNIAFKHAAAGGGWKPPLIVTAGVDRIQVSKVPGVGEGDQVLSGAISWVGRSSMEITMEAAVGGGGPWLEARFTFVARDRGTGEAAAIVPLEVEGVEERALFERGGRAAEMKKALRRQGSDLGSAYR